ncbi:MAG: HPr family phosphocarrier protein [Myxococcota bacterium]|nr:HPr family phosphocarrier protein [Myxococcota bacterium]
MIRGSTRVAGELGLHLRAAARLVSITGEASGPVRITANGVTVDGKSLLGITSLLAAAGTEVCIELDLEEDAAVLAAALACLGGGDDDA